MHLTRRSILGTAVAVALVKSAGANLPGHLVAFGDDDTLFRGYISNNRPTWPMILGVPNPALILGDYNAAASTAWRAMQDAVHHHGSSMASLVQAFYVLTVLDQSTDFRDLRQVVIMFGMVDVSQGLDLPTAAGDLVSGIIRLKTILKHIGQHPSLTLLLLPNVLPALSARVAQWRGLCSTAASSTGIATLDLSPAGLDAGDYVTIPDTVSGRPVWRQSGHAKVAALLFDAGFRP